MLAVDGVITMVIIMEKLYGRRFRQLISLTKTGISILAQNLTLIYLLRQIIV